ncbi:SRPBCC domain-containing protein [Frigidibacter sp. MR17.14]|uniref:SRPBCC family protein n=1 Tax=Frigidibacter sp. MR17.14 TaxID=3126509 RepID=UPI003012BA6F
MTATPTVNITRPMPAPRARVFRAFTTAEDLRGWFAPFPFTAPEAKVDPREGGAFEVCMAAPDGTRFWTRGTIASIVADSALTLDLAAHDAAGKKLFGALTTAVFSEAPMGSMLTVTQSYTPEPDCPPAVFAGAEIGWQTVLTQLTALVMRG